MPTAVLNRDRPNLYPKITVKGRWLEELGFITGPGNPSSLLRKKAG
ncbi:SymE family type I addiction module toxin [Photorhabdus khanii]